MRNTYRQALLGALLCAAAVAAPALAQTTVTGTMAAQFSVNESGAATYSIPIQVPPGVAGMQPQLSLDYNSQGGNGLLGMGWSLSGLSAITRCPKTMAIDGARGGVNFDSNDRFCLDGQRLLLVSGSYGADNSEYRMERESFSKIVAHGSAGNGPAYFIVQTKAGLTTEYGNTADSRIEAQGKPTVAVWAANKITDVKTNYMTFSYTEDATNGEFYPNRIDYAGNTALGQVPGNSVQFLYEARPDVFSRFVATSVIKSTQRMTYIKTYTGLTGIKDYGLSYEPGVSTGRSRLISLKECSAQTSLGCLVPMNFTFTDTGYSGVFSAWSDTSNLTSGAAGHDHYLIDINGDGLADLIQVGHNVSTALVSTNSGSGSFQTWAYSINLVGGAAGYVQHFTDVNGDGLADLIQVGRNVSTAWITLNPGDGNFQAPTYTISLVGGAAGYDSYFVDLNGDGLADLIQVGRNVSTAWITLNSGNGNFQTPTYTVSLVGGAAGYVQYFSDVNGDGLADLIQVGRNVSTAWITLNPGDGNFQAPTYTISLVGGAAGYDSYLVDLNGDGLADLIQVGRNVSTAWITLNSGSGNFQAPTYTVSLVGGAAGYVQYFSDVNGDGLADLIQVGRNVSMAWVSINPGDGNFQAPTFTTSLVSGAAGYVHFLTDINGDGLADLVQVGRNVNSISVSRNSKIAPDVMVDSARGSDEVASITYLSLINSSTYTKDSGTAKAVYPKVDLQYVVSTVSTSNGVGGTNTVQYSYGGLKAEQGTGRGMLGFRWMKSKSVANNIESYTEFNQNYPFTGTVAKNETRLAGSGNAGLLKRTVNTFAQGPGSAGTSVFVYPSQSVEESWDLSGTPYPSTTTNYVYGQSPQYGDPTQISVSNSEGSSKSTANEYWPANTASGNWILGRLKKASVTSVKP